MPPLFGDNDDKVVALLKQISQKLDTVGGGGGDTTVNVEDPDQGATWFFSTGEDKVAAPGYNSSPDSVEFGSPATVISVRPDGPLLLWIADPNRSQPVFIAGGEKFSIGSGDAPINTSEVWVKAHSSASGTVGLRLEAY